MGGEIGTKVNAELNKKKIPKKAKEKYPPSIDEKALRSKLGQALVNIKDIKKEDAFGNPLMVDVTGKLGWITLNLPNEDYVEWKYEKYIPDASDSSKTVLNPHYDAKKYDEYFSNPKYDKNNPTKYPQLIKNKNYVKPPSKRKDYGGLDFDNILNKLDLAYYNQYYLATGDTEINYSEIIRIDPNGTKYQIGKYNTVQESFPPNTFRCYFLEDQALSVNFDLIAGGGGSPGKPRSMFFADSGTDIGVLSHELGHNLGLKHTFTNDADIVYKFSTTDNIMDYNHKDMVFYHWQWKQMNSEGIT